jgi:hypothetical protein
VSEIPARPSVVQLLTLHEVVAYLRRSHGVGLAVFIAVAYALGSMLLGGMLVLAHLSGGYTVEVLWGNPLGIQPWNYPGVLIVAPWGFVELPFAATISMVLVSAGVGVGMAVALLLGYRLIAHRKTSAGTPTAAGAAAGMTPALIGLVTLGACCSVTAAATAGVGLVAQASGTSTTNLLLNNWFLGVFQVAVVYVALVAQELLLRVYGTLFSANDPGFARAPIPARTWDRRTVALAALRALLLAAGVTWILAAVADWTVSPPATASAALWFNWLVEHWLLGGFAMLVALSPGTVRGWARSIESSPGGRGLRVALLVGGGCLAGWVPPPFAGAGVEGFGNELLGLLGAPAGWGAVPPVFPWGIALLTRWSLQYFLLAGVAISAAIAPVRVLSFWAGATPLPSPEATPAAGTSSGAPARPDAQ